MLTCAVIGLLIGALFSRSKVLILIPPILFTLVIAIAVAIFENGAALRAAATATVVIIALQIGYLLGTALRDQTRRARESRPLSSTPATR